MELSALELALKNAWTRDTSNNISRWKSDNPALGQCAPTAIVVNDYLGGELVYAQALLPNGKKIWHYFNVIDGKEVDLTRTQFPEGTFVPKGVLTTREHILDDEDPQRRYEILKQRVQESLHT